MNTEIRIIGYPVEMGRDAEFKDKLEAAEMMGTIHSFDGFIRGINNDDVDTQNLFWESYLHPTDEKPLAKYRIRRADGTFVGAGTVEGSWFTLDKAKIKVRYSEGEQVVEHDGVNVLWEVM